MSWLSQLFGRARHDVFISYRRRHGSDLAQLLRRELTARGFRVFLDVRELHTGRFDEQLLHEIERSTHVVALLTAGALDKVRDSSDWMRRELAHALSHRRSVIPVAVERFEYPRNLPADIADLPQLQWVPYSHEFSDESIERLLRALGKPAATTHAPRRFTPKRVAIAGIGFVALVVGLASQCDTTMYQAGPLPGTYPLASGMFCCDVAGGRCVLSGPHPVQAPCFCQAPGQPPVQGLVCP